MVGALLTGEGYEVTETPSGVEAVARVRETEPDIALIDLMMPRLSGYELVQRIGTRQRRPVVIVATALCSSDVASVDDTLVRQVIRKPFDVQAIVAALNEVMQERKAKLPIAATSADEQKEKKSETAPPLNLQPPC